ncbi:hypothetical protein [Lutibacter sp.]|uniref:hypothetical protein n=1 Tax=Lutibacter sp. TaxID=1925666 RepID=UPI002735EABF|nr:hypothetical protein [Lutibacter sp.]MDP3312342.1 hypothetical protein [Lutibacter sp.]
MKNLFLVAVVFFSFILSIEAQDISRNALGLRLGNNDGFGTEISYQRELGEYNRLEIDLGFRDHTNSDAFKLSGIYQWVWNIDGGFNWYAGVGAGLGNWSKKSGFVGNQDDGLFLNLDGNVGIEYNFGIPLLISLDFRPEFGIMGDYGNDTNIDLALSLRYLFN